MTRVRINLQHGIPQRTDQQILTDKKTKADNLVLMYLGWEGVGLCSFLLIGFWYETPANVQAANKAFYITRIGDTAMAIGLFLLFRELGTLNIPEILSNAPNYFDKASPVATTIALLLLAGGIG